MGQHTKPESPDRLALTCRACGTDYWTDSTQSNDCPDCGLQDFDIHGPDNHH
jgi:predicted  nucleic acid-binding Zn-ribbon protein